MTTTTIDADAEFFHGLTIWTSSLSLQLRDTSLALHVKNDAMRSSENGNPVLLPKEEGGGRADLLEDLAHIVRGQVG